MIVLGIILILLAAGAATFAAIATGAATQAVELSAVGMSVTLTPLALFVSGAVALLLLVLGLWLVARGTRRKAQTRRELRQLRKEQAATPVRTSGTGSSPSGTATGSSRGVTEPSSAQRTYGMRDDTGSGQPPAPR